MPSEFLVDDVVDNTIYEDFDDSSDAQQPVAGPVLVTPKASHQPGNPSKRRKKNHENDRFDRALDRLVRLESKRAEEAREERRENQQLLLQVANSFADALNNLASAIVSKR